jgi:PAS domain S-box-containing protein
MIAPGSTTGQLSAARQDMLRAAANLAGEGRDGTLLLDGVGIIRNCGAAGAELFGIRHEQLIGRRISDFIADLFRAGSSPSFCARYLLHLCAADQWRTFAAKDADGREFTVELRLSQVVTERQGSFLLNVRRPD